MRRAALPLLLLAGAHAHAVGPVDDAVARVTQVAAWFRGGPAPRHWTVTKATDIRGAYGDWLHDAGAGAHDDDAELPVGGRALSPFASLGNLGCGRVNGCGCRRLASKFCGAC